MNKQNEIIALQERLDDLRRNYNNVYREIHLLQNQIDSLKKTSAQEENKEVIKPPEYQRQTKSVDKIIEPQRSIDNEKTSHQVKSTSSKRLKKKSDLEKLIGESIINKIGIIVLIIGIGIGSKYSIENNLISPLTRIFLGYLVGLSLILTGIKLKKNYLNYSAVLVSGAMTIMYFITFFAYSLYDLIPQLLSFGLMLIFTVFTVIASLNYNKQIIAHLGLVGAYAVPFLLSEGSNKVVILFSYVSIINIGILAISFKRYWKALFYSAFFLSWVIFAFWYFIDYDPSQQYATSLIFLSIFYLIFYITLLAYKLIKREHYRFDDIILLMLNSFIFYGLGYSILDNHQTYHQLLGIFTLSNAIIHFGVSILIYKLKLADKKLFLMIVGLVLVFATATIPVQLDSQWVTLLWALETALLFWLGRTQKASIYEVASYILMILAFLSFLEDYSSFSLINYDPKVDYTTPVFNVNFLVFAITIACFGFVTWLFFNKKHISKIKKDLLNLAMYMIPSILILTIYLAFRHEIFIYWDQLYEISLQKTSKFQDFIGNRDLLKFKNIWIINYSLLFVSILALSNIIKFKNSIFARVNFILIIIVLLSFLVIGLYQLSELRVNYLLQPSEYFVSTFSNIWIRYVSIAFLIFSLWVTHQLKHQNFLKTQYRKIFDFVLHVTVLWVLASELLHWLDIYDVGDNYKLGLSILSGMYSLFLIILGIWQRKKHLRIGAIVLFSLTLIKLFFYDMASLNTISKTIIFVSLGVLLLIISFLYNKFKQKIFGNDEN